MARYVNHPCSSGLSDLPLELFQRILREAILMRGIVRGLRLRLVNHKALLLSCGKQPFTLSGFFSNQVQYVLFLHNMLDATLSLQTTLPPFAAVYLEHRVTREPDDGNPALVCIRQVAARLTYDSETRSRYIAYLSALAVPNIKSVFAPNQPVYKAISQGTFEHHVQAAAVYMNHISDIERWEAPMTSSSLFGSCFQLTAASGSAEMIEVYLRQTAMSSVPKPSLRAGSKTRPSKHGSLHLRLP
jgi:hypothetical protein